MKVILLFCACAFLISKRYQIGIDFFGLITFLTESLDIVAHNEFKFAGVTIGLEVTNMPGMAKVLNSTTDQELFFSKSKYSIKNVVALHLSAYVFSAFLCCTQFPM